MDFFGRGGELGRLRSILDRRHPSLVLVSGVRGGGKTALVRRALKDYRGVIHQAPPLPDPTQRAGLRDVLRRASAELGLPAPPEEGVPDWSQIFAEAAAVASRGDRPFVLVIDDAHRLAEARSRYVEALTATLSTARERGVPIHVVLIGQEHGLPDPDRMAPLTLEALSLGPLPFRSAQNFFPTLSASDRVRAYAVFGGLPRVLESVDRDVTVETNTRRLLLDPAGTLRDAGSNWLERDLQTPARYNAIMSSLASGEGNWSTVHDGVPDLTSSGQVAPYLTRLEQLGLLRARRSLDAGPRTRARRYAITDPFLAFWFRFVMPRRWGEPPIPPNEYYSQVIRSAMGPHVESVFPMICRQHMSFDAIETLGANAREAGSIWGPHVEIPVAGILTSGAAYYGSCHWGAPARTAEPVRALDAAIRETRYGFGRERRVRVLFTGRSAPRWLQREVARRHDAQLIDAEALAGD